GMFNRNWRRAGPAGVADVALPAGLCSLISPMTFLAMVRTSLLEFLLLREIQSHGRFPAEHGDQDLDLALLGVDVVDDAHEPLEGARPHLDALADLEVDLGLRPLDAHLAQDALDLGLVQRRGLAAGPHEARDPGRVADHVPGVVGHDHLDQHVARENLALNDAALAVFDLDLFLHRDEDLEDLSPH